MSLVNMSQAGAAAQPSPSIWKDCPLDRLNKEGTGWYMHEDFLAHPVVDTTITAALLARLAVGSSFKISGDDDTVLTSKAAEQGGYMDIETDGDDNDGAALTTAPFAEIVLNSGNKVWVEARIEAGAVADQGIFFGLAEEAALSHDIVADNGIALIGESLIGFQVSSADTDGVDAVMKLDAGTVVKMHALISALAANTELKLGFKFDGKDQIELYLNGTKMSSYQIVASTFPDNVKMGVVLAAKTGTAAAQSIAVDWVRAAYQIRR